MTTWVDVGGRLVDRDAVLAEQFPSLDVVQGESPSAPGQRARRVAWESRTPFDRVRAQIAARERSSLRAQEQDADRFIARMEDRQALLRERLRVAANRRKGRGNPGPSPFGEAA